MNISCCIDQLNANNKPDVKAKQMFELTGRIGVSGVTEVSHRNAKLDINNMLFISIPLCDVFFVGNIFTARRSYARAVLGVVILSVCPPVCLSIHMSHSCFVTNPKNLPAIFLYHMKGQSF